MRMDFTNKMQKFFQSLFVLAGGFVVVGFFLYVYVCVCVYWSIISLYLLSMALQFLTA